jgi:exosortase/archaeosortase family protein
MATEISETAIPPTPLRSGPQTPSAANTMTASTLHAVAPAYEPATASPAGVAGVAEDPAGPRAAVFLGARVAFVVAVSIGAFHYSLYTLLHGLSLTSPLAYLGLVPLIALMLATARALQSRDEPDIHDSYLDWIVGIPLLVSALLIMTVVPAHLSTYFWLWRLDLVSLPLFVAGVIDLTFGARALWRLRVPVVFLGLASPAPYLLLADGQLRFLADASLTILRQLTSLLSLAHPVPGADGSLFLITHTGRDFVLGVNSASTGTDSVLGFLLVGVAIAAVVAGPLLGRLGWLIAGATLIWLLDLVRVLALFAAGRAWGEEVVLQPFAGLAALVLGALAMMVVLPWFRLRVEMPQPPASRVVALTGEHRPRRPALRRVLPALAVLLAAGLIAGVANDGLDRFALVATPLGQPVLEAGAASSHPVNGWALRKTQSYPWIAAYMGKDATWDRYEYAASPGRLTSSPLGQPSLLTLDVFTTADRGRLAGYGIEEAYHLNRYRLLEAKRADLGGGVIGYAVLYRNRVSSQTWSAVYWDWPVQTPSGVAYERVVVNHGKEPVLKPSVTAGESEPSDGPTPGTASQGIPGGAGLQMQDDAGMRDFLVRFSREVITAAAGARA